MTPDRVGEVQPLQISTPKVDFFTATVKCRAGKGATLAHSLRVFYEDIGNYWGGAFMHIMSSDDTENCPHMNRYQIGLKDRLTGVVFSIGGDTETIRLEASGAVCTTLRAMLRPDGKSALNTIVEAPNQNCTRLDLCADMNYPLPPYYVCETRQITRIKGERYDVSETGWTYYIGSFTSDRLCRIYLYEKPHPRCNSTRVEYQNRDTYANAVREAIISDGCLEISFKRLTNTFGLTLIQELCNSQDYGRFTASSEKSPNPNTLKWAWDTVFPALVKLHRDGGFNIDAFAKAIIEKSIEGE